MSDKELLQKTIARIEGLKPGNPSLTCPKDLDSGSFGVGVVECKHAILAILDELLATILGIEVVTPQVKAVKATIEQFITTPCIVDGMSDAEYHNDPVVGGSLSSSGAKSILRSPAHHKWQQGNRVEKTAFDLGHAVHLMVLGIGLDIITIPSSLLGANGATSTKEAKAFIADARDAGKVPLKEEVVAECSAMTESVLTHPIARKLLEQEGAAEQSLFVPDPESGVWLRARVDYLPKQSSVLVDLKTSVSADPRDFMRSAAEYGYDIQSEFYQHALRLVRGDKDTTFQFIVVEKSAPYLVSVIELDAEFAAIGKLRMRRAIELFKECTEKNEWGGYEEITHLVGPPSWLAYQEGMDI